MKVSLKHVIAGLAAFTILSIPAHAPAPTFIHFEKERNPPPTQYELIEKDVSELKDTVEQISNYTGGLVTKRLEGESYEYAISFSRNNEYRGGLTSINFDFKFKIIDKETNKRYTFIDKKADGVLDAYIGSQDFYFTEEGTPSKKWEKLQDNYHRLIKKSLDLAKKVLKEKNSSLDKDLEDMQ